MAKNAVLIGHEIELRVFEAMRRAGDDMAVCVRLALAEPRRLVDLPENEELMAAGRLALAVEDLGLDSDGRHGSNLDRLRFFSFLKLGAPRNEDPRNGMVLAIVFAHFRYPFIGLDCVAAWR